MPSIANIWKETAIRRRANVLENLGKPRVIAVERGPLAQRTRTLADLSRAQPQRAPVFRMPVIDVQLGGLPGNGLPGNGTRLMSKGRSRLLDVRRSPPKRARSTS